MLVIIIFMIENRLKIYYYYYFILYTSYYDHFIILSSFSRYLILSFVTWFIILSSFSWYLLLSWYILFSHYSLDILFYHSSHDILFLKILQIIWNFYIFFYITCARIELLATAIRQACNSNSIYKLHVYGWWRLSSGVARIQLSPEGDGFDRNDERCGGDQWWVLLCAAVTKKKDITNVKFGYIYYYINKISRFWR